MDVALRVWERYRLAARVADRVKRGDAIGDPRDLLVEYKRTLAKYAEVESEANAYLAAWPELEKLLLEGGPPTFARQKEIRLTKLNRGADIRMYLRLRGFKALQHTAKLLCLALLQQVVLPPKTRKSIEAAAKFWTRNMRLNPKGRTYEEGEKNSVEMYLEMLEVFRKYEKLFETAIHEGTPHSDQGEAATRLKAGPFTLVNTGGFDLSTMQEKAKLVEEAASAMHRIGLGNVCYGDVLITNRLSGEFIAAFYLPSKDEMFVRADAKGGGDTVRIICHELAHRYEHKHLSGRSRDIVALYRKLNTHAMISTRYEDFPKRGEPLDYKGQALVVSDVDTRRKTIKLKDPTDQRHVYSMPLQSFQRLKGQPEKIDPLDFVTSYAKRGGPSENFAEMASFFAIGKLPKEQVDLLLPLLS